MPYLVTHLELPDAPEKRSKLWVLAGQRLDAINEVRAMEGKQIL